MNELPEAAVRRWAEAAALLAGVGRVPAALATWLGPAWSGPAARAYDEWAGGFEQATRRASGALRDAADSIRLFAGRWPELRFEVDLGCVDAGSRSIAEVPVPGQRGQPSASASKAEPPHDNAEVPSKPGSPPVQPDPQGPPPDLPGPPPDVPVPLPELPGTHRDGPTNHVQGWIQQAVAALREHGYPPEQIDPEAIATIIEHESSGNPEAVNNWDSNAARGTPSMGLMQTIEPTFDRWHLPGHGEILDPVDNIIAGVRYAVARYGSVSQVPGLLSLAAGGAYRGY
jgi:hypothetical protein